MRRRSVSYLGAALGTALLPGAPRSHTPSPSRSDGGRVLRIVSPFEFAGPDPARSGSVPSRMRVGEMLLGGDPEGRPVPMLAAHWSASTDGLL